MNQKTCPTCKKPRPVSQFHRDKTTPDGLHPQCKSCRHVAGYRRDDKRADANNALFDELNADKEFHDLLINLGH